jgi:hypothetical protein
MLGTYERLGVHVMASNMDVLRAARKKLKNPSNRGERKARHKFYRQMLTYHRKARELYRHVTR